MTRAVFAIVLMAAASGALGQLRSIPADATRGHMTHVQESIVDVDGRRARLAPGSQIRGPDNFVVLPSALPPGSLVKYRVDAEGMIKQVWILSPQEAAQPDRRP